MVYTWYANLPGGSAQLMPTFWVVLARPPRFPGEPTPTDVGTTHLWTWSPSKFSFMSHCTSGQRTEKWDCPGKSRAVGIYVIWFPACAYRMENDQKPACEATLTREERYLIFFYNGKKLCKTKSSDGFINAQPNNDKAAKDCHDKITMYMKDICWKLFSMCGMFYVSLLLGRLQIEK